MKPLQVGDAAPDFTLRDQHGADVTLSSFAGEKAVLIVFYPYAFSGVCTGELTGFRDRLGEFKTDTTTLIAVSCSQTVTSRTAWPVLARVGVGVGEESGRAYDGTRVPRVPSPSLPPPVCCWAQPVPGW